MAKSLRSKKIRAHKAIKRSATDSVFRKTHDDRTARLNAKIVESARGPKRARTPEAESAIEVVEEDGDEAPMAVDEGLSTPSKSRADSTAEPAPAAPSAQPVSTLRSNERKKLRQKGKQTSSKSAKRKRIANSFKPEKGRRSKSGTAKA